MSDLPAARDLADRLVGCLNARGPEAGERLAAMVEGVAPAEVGRLGESFRRLGYWLGLQELVPAEVERVSRGHQGWAACAVLSLHWIGYVREAAVRALRRLKEPRALPFVLVRLNDWVPQVRTVAFMSLGEFLEARFAPWLIASLPLLLGLGRQGRANHQAAIETIERFLVSPACADALAAGCQSAPDRVSRLYCLRLAATAPAATAAVLGRAVRDADPAIRRWAVDQAGRVLDPPSTSTTSSLPLTAEEARALATAALTDRAVQVRRRALRVLADGLPAAELRALAEEVLLDESTSARWQARMMVLGQGPFDLAAFYRRAVAEARSRPRLRGALRGLGESGSPDDVPTVQAHLAGGPISVRRAAARALADLQPLATIDPFLALLVGAEPGLSSDGRRALAPRLAYVPVARLAAIVRSTAAPTHARRNTVSLLGTLSKWVALPLLLRAAADPDDETAARGRLLLMVWEQRYNQSFEQPTHAQLDEAEAELARLGTRGDRRIETVEQTLRMARRFARSV